MTPQDFDFMARLLKKHSGFLLIPSQLYLLENRLAPILRQYNLTTLEDLVTSLKLNNVELRRAVIEAVSINNTRFFRNQYVFDTIKEFLQNKNDKIKDVRVLSVGCANGQEPVSVALLLNEMGLMDIDVTALDMSHVSITQAKKAVYTHYEVQKGLPVQLLLKYFNALKDGNWQLKPEVLHQIHYSVHNILSSFNEGNFDIVLCRNMLSFMAEEAQITAFQNLSDMMKPDGVLIVGAAEVLPSNPYFEKVPHKIACYKKQGS